MDRVDLIDLMAFSVLAEEGSFRRAATKLGVSPSALSHSMSRLEAKYGTALLLRTTRSIAPTDPGLERLQRLKPAFDEIDRGFLQLAGRSGRVAGHVRINVHRDAAGLPILPKFRDLQRDYPEIRGRAVARRWHRRHRGRRVRRQASATAKDWPRT
ncbi:LysR family transcriptional regulator [Sphingomonas sp.]|uniref:LysR family transcriptional regulator n=1 Tax=Sphingomonas sp. TaxID=28214 RepID=UPI003AFFA7D6